MNRRPNMLGAPFPGPSGGFPLPSAAGLTCQPCSPRGAGTLGRRSWGGDGGGAPRSAEVGWPGLTPKTLPARRGVASTRETTPARPRSRARRRPPRRGGGARAGAWVEAETLRPFFGFCKQTFNLPLLYWVGSRSAFSPSREMTDLSLHLPPPPAMTSFA